MSINVFAMLTLLVLSCKADVPSISDIEGSLYSSDLATTFVSPNSVHEALSYLKSN